jgi:hypothetical protein
MRHYALALSLLCGAASGVAVSCVTTDDQGLKSFFAPNFKTIDDTLLQDSMWRLGRGVQDLDDTIKAEGLSEDDRHAQIMASLDMMAAAAAQANDPGKRQGHNNVAMNIGKLVADIDAAKAAAVNKDYALAEALPATCLNCHQGGGGGPQTP